MKLISLVSFGNEFEARILAQRLEEEGIPAVVKPLAGGYGVLGVNQFIPHRVYVPEGSIGRAREIAGVRDPEVAPEDIGLI